jgi:hypothetical protein
MGYNIILHSKRRIKKKKTPLQHEFFYVDPKVHIKMNKLKKNATWIPLILQLKKLYNSHVIIQALNTTSLCQHYEDINHDHNL